MFMYVFNFFDGRGGDDEVPPQYGISLELYACMHDKLVI